MGPFDSCIYQNVERPLKWIAFVMLLAAIAPLTARLRRHPNDVPKLCMLAGLLPWDFVHLFMSIVGFPDWPGHVAGIEFSLLDGIAIALYLALPAAREPLPFKLSMGAYFLANIVSVFQADVPMAAVFYVWQLARMFLVYAAFTKACADPRVPIALVKGVAMGLILEAGYVIFQRFGLGIIQAAGTFSAQNFLGLMSHFAVFPVFALLLVRRQGPLITIAALAGIVVELFTTSRATVGLAALGYSTLFLISAFRKWTSRKARMLAVGLAVIAVAAPIAVSSFQERFTHFESQAWYNPNQEDERIQFERVAARMLADHPFGVGPNHYVISANHDGYNVQEQIPLDKDDLLAIVHNVYWLIADESGYAGIVTFVLLLLQPLILAFRVGWHHRGDIRGDLLLGIATSFLVVYIHSLYEWIFITFEAQYLFVLSTAMVVGLSRQLSYQPGSQKKAWRIPSAGVSTNGRAGDHARSGGFASRQLSTCSLADPNVNT